jgi:hypothetical protein
MAETSTTDRHSMPTHIVYVENPDHGANLRLECEVCSVLDYSVELPDRPTFFDISRLQIEHNKEIRA